MLDYTFSLYLDDNNGEGGKPSVRVLGSYVATDMAAPSMSPARRLNDRPSIGIGVGHGGQCLVVPNLPSGPRFILSHEPPPWWVLASECQHFLPPDPCCVQVQHKVDRSRKR